MVISARNPSHPGGIVRAVGFEFGTSPAQIAERIGVDLAELQPVLDGEAPMTPSLAKALEDAGSGNAAYWMRAQTQYELAQERLRRERTAETGTEDGAATPAAAPRQAAAASAS